MDASLLSRSTYLITFLVAVVIVDVTKRRIPNWLTLSAAIVALVLNFSKTGSDGALTSSAGLLTGLAAFLPFYLARGFGAGDVKAMGAVGAFLGPQGALLAAAWTLVAGAIGALLVLIVRREYLALRSLVTRWLLRGYALYAAGQAHPLAGGPNDPTRRRFPYGLAIASGTLVSMAWRTP
jgi:prepilin peptidase CpaA